MVNTVGKLFLLPIMKEEALDHDPLHGMKKPTGKPGGPKDRIAIEKKNLNKTHSGMLGLSSSDDEDDDEDNTPPGEGMNDDAPPGGGYGRR
jgi:hypothetical protein